MKLNVYVLCCMSVTPDTAHFEISLLNADASLNAVQIIQQHNTNRRKSPEQISKQKKIEKIILAKWKNYKEKYKKKENKIGID